MSIDQSYSVKELYKLCSYLQDYYDCDHVLLDPWKTFDGQYEGFIVYKFKPNGQPTSYTHRDISMILNDNKLFKCSLNDPNCKENCGNYGCGN